MIRIVHVHLKTQSQPIKRNDVINTYSKDGMFCVQLEDKVEKYPHICIHNVVEFN